MVQDTVAGGTGEPRAQSVGHSFCEEYRDDLSAQLRIALSPGSSIVPASAPAHPIGDADAEFLRSVLGLDWDRLPDPPGTTAPDRGQLEALGPREPRLALLWSEALVAISRMLAEDCDTVQDERTDARRLVSEILSDALGRRCATAWLVDAWLRLCDDPTDREIAESLRHASRLAETGSWIERQAVLMQAAYKVADATAGGSEIAETVNRLGMESPQDILRSTALIWHSGGTEPAIQTVRAVLEDIPEMGVELLGAPRYRMFAPEVRRHLGALLDTTRNVVRRRSLAVAELHALCNEIASAAGSPFLSIVDEVVLPVDNLDLRTGRRLGGALAREWDETHRDWSEKVSVELTRLSTDLAKLERFLQNAVKERDYWAANVAGVEEEAKAHGYALHAYGVFGLFQGKKRRRSEQMRAHYEQCRLNLEQAENLLRQQENRARHDIQNLGRRIQLLESFAARLTALERPA